MHHYLVLESSLGFCHVCICVVWQILLLQRLSASLAELSTPPPSTAADISSSSSSLPIQPLPSSSRPAVAAPSWGTADDFSVSSGGGDGGLPLTMSSSSSTAAASGGSGSARNRGMMSWMWRTFVSDEDDSQVGIQIHIVGCFGEGCAHLGL